jgi:hypothetical protein
MEIRHEQLNQREASVFAERHTRVNSQRWPVSRQRPSTQPLSLPLPRRLSSDLSGFFSGCLPVPDVFEAHPETFRGPRLARMLRAGNPSPSRLFWRRFRRSRCFAWGPAVYP